MAGRWRDGNDARILEGMSKKKAQQPTGGAVATGRAALPAKPRQSALLSAVTQRARQVAQRSVATGRPVKVSTPGVSKTAKPVGGSGKAKGKPAPAAMPAVTLTGKSGLVGFFDSGRSDLSRRAKDIARRRES